MKTLFLLLIFLVGCKQENAPAKAVGSPPNIGDIQPSPSVTPSPTPYVFRDHSYRIPVPIPPLAGRTPYLYSTPATPEECNYIANWRTGINETWFFGSVVYDRVFYRLDRDGAAEFQWNDTDKTYHGSTFMTRNSIALNFGGNCIVRFIDPYTIDYVEWNGIRIN